jgi:hypothetical protein
MARPILALNGFADVLQGLLHSGLEVGAAVA